jgi:hypothetical protein
MCTCTSPHTDVDLSFYLKFDGNIIQRFIYLVIILIDRYLNLRFL